MGRHELDSDPLAQFAQWFAEARAAGVRRPRAMTLATAAAGRPPVGADGAPQGARTGRLLLLHEPREPQGRRARGEPPRGARPLLAAARPPGAGRGRGRAARRRRLGRVLRVPASRLADRRPGPRRSHAPSPGGTSSSAPSSRSRRAIAGDGGPLPPFWGGYRVVPGRDRVLAGPPQPLPRPRPLRAATGPGGRAPGSAPEARVQRF